MKKLLIFLSSILFVLGTTTISFASVTYHSAPHGNYTLQIILSILETVGPIALIVGLIASIIWLVIESGKMKTVSIKTSARDYGYDFNLTNEHDIFLYTTTTRVRVEDHKD